MGRSCWRDAACKLTFAFLAIVGTSACDPSTSYRSDGVIVGAYNPSTYAYVILSPQFEYSERLETVLIEKGYSVVTAPADVLRQQFRLDRGQVLAMDCAYLGHSQRNLWGTSASVYCEAFDLASGETVYIGNGEYMGMYESHDISGAIQNALEALPSTGHRGGEVAALQLPSRGGSERRPGSFGAGEGGKESSGTAFFVSADGHLITNHHVIDDCDELRIHHRGIPQRVSLARIDRTNDLALLRMNGRPDRFASFPPPRSLRAGDSVIAVGYPLRGILADEATVTRGTVNALAGIGNDRRTIQISAPVQPGNSGGPLLDESGRVVGVVVAKLDDAIVFAMTGDIPQNVNFAINRDRATAFLEASDVEYRQTSRTQTMSVADIADLAKDFTVPLECISNR